MRTVTLTLDGQPVTVAEGTTVAALLLNQNRPARRSVTGQLRAPLCGMGICFECRCVIDGMQHVRSCLVRCREGMTVVTA